MSEPEPELPPAPRQADLDTLLSRAHRVQIFGSSEGPPLRGSVIATFEKPELGALRDALRIVENGEWFHCMCCGDLAIDVRGRMRRLGLISYHHGVSIRVDGKGSDARLVDGPALLRLLAARGVTEPLARYEADIAANREWVAAAERWRAAAPAWLRERLDALAGGWPQSEHDHAYDDALDDALAGGGDDRALAAELLAWLGSADESPWSGFPSYELVPSLQLGRLPPKVVLAAIAEADDDAALLGAARFVCGHEVVSFRKRMVAAVSQERFERFGKRLERAAMSDEGKVDARARLQRARDIAVAARERKARLAKERDRELACVAVSEDGSFAELVTDGERLVALDVFTVVDIDVDTGELSPLVTYTGSPFTELVMADGVLYVVRNNDGRLERIVAGVKDPWRVAEGLARPMHPIACGGVVCMISAPFEEYPGENGIRYSRQRTSIVRIEPDGSPATIVPVERGVASLAADATHLYFSSTDLEGKGVIERVARSGGKVQRLVDVKANGHAMARPRMVVDGEQLVYVDGPAVCRVPVGGGRAQTIAKLPGPVGAITPVDGGYVAIVGASEDEKWHVERIGREGQRSRVGTLERRPYHRLVLVTRRRQAFFTLDERLYRVR